MHNFLKRTLTKFLNNSDLEWDEFLPFTCYCYNIFPSSNGTKSPFFLMVGWDPAEECLSHLNNSNEGKILFKDHHKVWKHHTKHLKVMHQRNEHREQKLIRKTQHLKFTNESWWRTVHHTFEQKYLLDYGVLKIFNDSTLLLVLLNEKESKTNINYVKPCSTTELVENAWSYYPGSIIAKHKILTINSDLDDIMNKQCINICFKYVFSSFSRNNHTYQWKLPVMTNTSRDTVYFDYEMVNQWIQVISFP